jgi:hypothetical protein
MRTPHGSKGVVVVYLLALLSMSQSADVSSEETGGEEKGMCRETSFGTWAVFQAPKQQESGKRLSDLVSDRTPSGITWWQHSKTRLLCVVMPTPELRDDGFVESLSIYDSRNDQYWLRCRYNTGDGLVSVSCLTDNDEELLTVWAGGSAYHIVVFALIEKEVEIVLELGTTGGSPLIEHALGGNRLIVVGDGSQTVNGYVYPEQAIFYKRQSRNYVKLETAPWTERFRILDALTVDGSRMCTTGGRSGQGQDRGEGPG